MTVTELMQQPIRDIIRGKLATITLSQDATIGMAVDSMREHRRGAILLTDEDGRLAGVFTERDLVCELARRPDDWADRPLTEGLTPDPVTVGADASIADAVAHLNSRRVRHMPVVDDDGRPVALLSVRDVMAYMAEQFPDELINIPPKPSLEAAQRWGG